MFLLRTASVDDSLGADAAAAAVDAVGIAGVVLLHKNQHTT
jgi:hypothetical protein